MPSPYHHRLTRFTLLVLLAALLFRGAVAQYVPASDRGGGTRFTGRDGGVRKGIGIEESVELGGRDTADSSSTNRSMWLISHTDFCLFGPPSSPQAITETNRDVVSWCTSSAHGARLIPDGTLHGVTYVKADSWVQVSGSGDFTKINIAAGDAGGQFDSTSNTPEGATMYVSPDGQEQQQAGSWVTLISADTFCVRACTGDPKYCPADYDEMGCYFFTSNGVGWDDVYQDCEGDDGDPPGVIDGQTYTQGNSPTPTPTTAPVSNCQVGSSVSNGQTAASGSDSSPSGSTSSGSTSWVPVQTCVPCTDTAGGAAATDTASGSGDGSTMQAGVTQNSATGGVEAVAAVQASGSASGSTSSSGTLTAATTLSVAVSGGENGGNGGDLLDRWLAQRDGGTTTTTNGQCCFTTWTASVVGGTAKATGTASGSASQETGSASGSASQETGSASGSASGSSAGSDVALSTAIISASGSTKGSSTKVTGTAKVSGEVATATGMATASTTLKTGNGTTGGNSSKNGSSETSGAFGGRLDIRGAGEYVGRLLWAVGGTGLALVAGGLVLV